ncbi:MAG: TetR/AcrR family transcriptional regulator [Deltaproteobacteria bacterium]|nr:TetR/AcrR family transcriptional regulator [Deltaproteobacteria bacterium]
MNHPNPSTPAPRVRDADATRSRVLVAAEGLFARKGFDGTRLREVAELARVSVPLLVHHFKDKENLYLAVMERGIERFASLGWEVLRQGSSVAEQLTGFVTRLIDLASQEPDLTALVHREMATGGTRAGPAAERLLRPLKDAATQLLSHAQSRGEVRRGVDLDMLVLSVAGSVLYPCLAAPLVRVVWNEDPQGKDFLSRQKRTLLELLMPLLVAPAQAG